VARDALEDVQRDAEVGRLCERGVPQFMAHQAWLPDVAHELALVGGVAQGGGGDGAAAWPGQQPRVDLPAMGKPFQRGLRAWSREDLEAPGEFRLHRATISEPVVLDEHDGRRPVHMH
jgi:hypothetical protein